MISLSIKPPAQLAQFIPTSFTLKYYRSIWIEQNFIYYMFNSLIITISAMLLLQILGIMPAYAIARWSLNKTLLSTMVFRSAPPVGFLIPFFTMFFRLRMIDTHISVILVHTARLLPLYIWLMVGYFRNIPRELEESAMVDGCSRFRAVLKIILPVTAPGLIATTIVCFIYSWNDLLYALVLTSSTARTLPVAVSSLLSYGATNWGKLGAGATIVVLPVIIFGVAVQKYLVKGLTAGAVKE